MGPPVAGSARDATRGSPARILEPDRNRRRAARSHGLKFTGERLDHPQPLLENPVVSPTEKRPRVRTLNMVGLFAGIGGLERGLEASQHHTLLLCENDPAACEVLRRRFPDVRIHEDVRDLRALPRDTDLVVAGFPCQDLSQAGATHGIRGRRSGLVDEVFRLLETSDVPWLLLENVPFMLRLQSGRAMRHIVGRLTELGYAWAYRVIDSMAFGLPQRRERVFLLASKVEDPAPLLMSDDRVPRIPRYPDFRACGFYWTEGNRGLGWAPGAVPTLKGGSTVGIPSPPAIWMPDGSFVTPDIRDAERLQGFPQNWTRPAERVGRSGYRWRLVGNAVTVPVAKWIGERIAGRGRRRPVTPSGIVGRSWPRAAARIDGVDYEVGVSTWPVHRKLEAIDRFLRHPPRPLSWKAAAGFLRRLNASTLRAPEEFRADLEQYVALQEAAVP